jgi:peptide deformylase
MLHEPSRPVRRFDERLGKLIQDMIETMRAAEGIGLAAIQVGVPQRVIVIEVPVEHEEDAAETEESPRTELYVLINPEITSTSVQKEEEIEGCLSIPGWAGEVERYQSVTVEGMDRHGDDVCIHAEGLLARVLQHEIDHCQGTVFIDRIDDPEKIWSVKEDEGEAAEAA